MFEAHAAAPVVGSARCPRLKAPSGAAGHFWCKARQLCCHTLTSDASDACRGWHHPHTTGVCVLRGTTTWGLWTVVRQARDAAISWTRSLLAVNPGGAPVVNSTLFCIRSVLYHSFASRMLCVCLAGSVTVPRQNDVSG